MPAVQYELNFVFIVFIHLETSPPVKYYYKRRGSILDEFILSNSLIIQLTSGCINSTYHNFQLRDFLLNRKNGYFRGICVLAWVAVTLIICLLKYEDLRSSKILNITITNLIDTNVITKIK